MIARDHPFPAYIIGRERTVEDRKDCYTKKEGRIFSQKNTLNPTVVLFLQPVIGLTHTFTKLLKFSSCEWFRRRLRKSLILNNIVRRV